MRREVSTGVAVSHSRATGPRPRVHRSNCGNAASGTPAFTGRRERQTPWAPVSAASAQQPLRHSCELHDVPASLLAAGAPGNQQRKARAVGFRHAGQIRFAGAA